jgi:hypothetical protein
MRAEAQPKSRYLEKSQLAKHSHKGHQMLKNEARILKIGANKWTAQCHNSSADMNGNISDTVFTHTSLTHVISCMHNATSILLINFQTTGMVFKSYCILYEKC